jgi:hypothetical protein
MSVREPRASGAAETCGGDSVAKAGPLTFAPGEMTKTLTIPVKGDSSKEANEYFDVDPFGHRGPSPFTKDRGTGWVRNDD